MLRLMGIPFIISDIIFLMLSIAAAPLFSLCLNGPTKTPSLL